MKALLNQTKGDKYIWIIVLMLSVISLMAVYSAAGTFNYRERHNSSYYLMKQTMILGFGLCITYIVHRVNYIKFSQWAVALYYVSLPLLAYTLIFGRSVNGATRFIGIPGTPLTFQSSDLAKLALFMFLARRLSEKKDVITDFKKGFLPVMMPMLFTCLLIAPANLSTALLLGTTCTIIFYIGRVKGKHIMFLAACGFMAITILVAGSLLLGKGRGVIWKGRMQRYFYSLSDKKDIAATSDDQVTMAKTAIAFGGFTGQGPGKSRQRYSLPLPYSDFIYAIIIEEWGILGGAFVMFLYLAFLWRSILIFRRCPYAFGAFLAVGLSITLVFQAMVNMGVNVNLLPVTGLTLPMISMGGSSIWFTSIAIGIILSVNKYVDEEEQEKTKKPAKPRLKEQKITTEATEVPMVQAEAGESKIIIKTGRKTPKTITDPTA